ncbi:hypothetical protein [Neptuniibacter sp. QD37_11]|uniref:hypothetical protein n=1 Tax=Neptuniibacter sp. QD37_11 TaxID=3398209 RepID=UPI0039F4DF7E
MSFYANPVLPTRSEFDVAVEEYRNQMGLLFKLFIKPSNPKLKELVARTYFRQENGYQSLTSHWKSVDQQSIVRFPAGISPILNVVVDYNDSFWLYLGDVEEFQHNFDLADAFFSADPHDLENDDESFVPLDVRTESLLKKFYKPVLVNTQYWKASLGRPF